MSERTALAASRLFDNPFRGRALRIDVRPGRLGVHLLIHAGLLLLAVYGLNQLFAWDEFQRDVAMYVGFRRMLFGVLAFFECIWVTLYVPLRCGLVIHSDERNKCLDQIAASGLSPLSIAAGHLGAVLAAICLHLTAALPFFGLCFVLGEVPIADMAAALAVVVTYALALGSLAVSFGMLKHFAAPLLLIPLVIIIAFPCFIPDSQGMPTAVAAISPVRPLMFLTLGQVADFARHFNEPVWSGITVPCWTLSCAYFLGVAALAWISVAAGPDLRLSNGLNDFDAVTLGARKGKRLKRWCGWLLVRKVRLSFLYENRPRWLKRWSNRLREGLFLLITMVIFAAIAGLCVPHVRATKPTSWSEGVQHLLDWRPSRQAAGDTDGALALYAVFAGVWAVAVLPYTRRRTRDRVLDGVYWGCHTIADQPLSWHVAGLIAPAGMLVLALWLAGKPMLLAMRLQCAGFWLMTAMYSLAAGSIVAVTCSRVKSPTTSLLVAGLLVAALFIGPLAWYPLFLFGLLPAWVCYVSVAALPMGLYLTWEPWQDLEFERFSAPDFRFYSDWHITLAIYVVAAFAAIRLCRVVMRKARAREQAERAARANADS